MIAGMTVFSASFLFPGSAESSCGDYLAGHQNRSVETDNERDNTNSLSGLSSITLIGLFQGNLQSDPSSCEGRKCDRAPVSDFPFAPAPDSRVSDNHDQWGAFSVLRVTSKKLSSPWPDAAAAFSNRGHHRRVDRPPAKGSAGSYNHFWNPRRRPSAQTSLIIDPPDGRLPPRTPEGQRRADIRAIPRIERLDTGGCEDRDLWERCISMGVPRLPGGYNNNLQIFQTPDHVAILIEMVHEVRIIPLRPRPHIAPRIRQYLGDSRGYWDGDTLVVETTNFAHEAHFFDYRDFRGSTGNLHLVERFTRVDADTLHYEFTVTEPTTFTTPWTARVPITKTEEPIFEYACHEGNYALANILRGARVQERAAGESSR